MLIYFINEYWKITFFDHCWAYLPRNFRNKRCNWAKNRKGLDINKSVVKNKDHCIIFAVGGVTEKRDFWSFFVIFGSFDFLTPEHVVERTLNFQERWI